jgi:hypothetical protein
MTTENLIRYQLVRRIKRIPSNKLNDVVDYLSKLELTTDKPSQVLTFAGCWSTIDTQAFEELTGKLMDNRKKNTRRIHE